MSEPRPVTDTWPDALNAADVPAVPADLVPDIPTGTVLRLNASQRLHTQGDQPLVLTVERVRTDLISPFLARHGDETVWISGRDPAGARRHAAVPLAVLRQLAGQAPGGRRPSPNTGPAAVWPPPPG